MKIVSFFEWLRTLLGAKPPKSFCTTTKTAPKQKDIYVYVTLKGKKFHYDLLCPGIRNSKEIKMELSKARKAGYVACDKCCYSYLHD